MIFHVMFFFWCFEEVLNAQAGVYVRVFQIWDESCSSNSIKIGLEHIENRKSHTNLDDLPIQDRKSSDPKVT